MDDNTESQSTIECPKLLGKVSPKAQSAMEYLMTYGWAILAIAVVLGVLYSLGVFNPENFAPKAQPGSCQVYRPNGPETTSFINLAGSCTDEIPQYVAVFNGPTGGCCGGSHTNYIIVGNQPVYNDIKSNITVVGWVMLNPTTSSDTGNYNYIVSNDRDCCGTYYGYALWMAGTVPHFRIWNGSEHSVASSISLQSGIWYQIAATFNGSDLKIYVDGKSEGTSAYSGEISQPANFSMKIGMLGVGPPYGINGYMANIQIYNRSFGANAVQSLYDEGIGGNPTFLNNLVGWWPLNGNANDSSGNNGNGTTVNVGFSGSWQSGYTPP